MGGALTRPIVYISKCGICCGQRTNRFREDNGEVIEVIEQANGAQRKTDRVMPGTVEKQEVEPLEEH